MEAFEQFAAVHLENQGLVVTGPTKFPVARQVKKVGRDETQTHGYEVDLIGARSDKLVLASVKSFFGSQGVMSYAVNGTIDSRGGFRLLNDEFIRSRVIGAAAKRYGYTVDQVELRLYVGKFGGGRRSAEEEATTREWCDRQKAGGGPIQVFSINDIIQSVIAAASSMTYRDNPVIVTLKALAQADVLQEHVAASILHKKREK
jgi:hypothetical protein